mmetsp:Transcript_53260/g.129378  ORF Transcript_53260/g.129378 Transcript_53260/m.129378 type:complete len:227 (+) Transcript_53260:782-1462(+)
MKMICMIMASSSTVSRSVSCHGVSTSWRGCSFGSTMCWSVSGMHGGWSTSKNNASSGTSHGGKHIGTGWDNYNYRPRSSHGRHRQNDNNSRIISINSINHPNNSRAVLLLLLLLLLLGCLELIFLRPCCTGQSTYRLANLQHRVIRYFQLLHHFFRDLDCVVFYEVEIKLDVLCLTIHWQCDYKFQNVVGIRLGVRLRIRLLIVFLQDSCCNKIMQRHSIRFLDFR